MSDDWYTPAEESQIRRERERARLLRRSSWWKACLEKGECYYCHGHFAPAELTMDHLIPVARGGHSDKGNVVPACFACNQEKSARTPAELILESLHLPDLPEEEGRVL
ncbi:MAG: HNH endonuclease [Kiritimatiellia bacterium]